MSQHGMSPKPGLQSGSRSGSAAPAGRSGSSAPSGRSRSVSTGSAGKPADKLATNPFPKGLGYDPGRDVVLRPAYQAKIHPADNKNIDLPPEAYLMVSSLLRPESHSTLYN